MPHRERSELLPPRRGHVRADAGTSAVLRGGGRTGNQDDDQQLLADMLDAEGGDAMQVLERLVDASLEADAMADAAKARKADMAERQARFERRRDTLRSIAKSALEALNPQEAGDRDMDGIAAAEPAATGHLWGPVTSADWFRITREPMKGEIRKALAAGQEIEGAEFGNADVGITIRTR